MAGRPCLWMLRLLFRWEKTGTVFYLVDAETGKKNKAADKQGLAVFLKGKHKIPRMNTQEKMGNTNSREKRIGV